MKEALKIWLMDKKLKRAHDLGFDRPFEEHVLFGYSCFSAKYKQIAIEDLSAKVEISTSILPSGGSVTFLQPLKISTQKILVSIHGGPESFESTEIRYLGLYRELLRKGWCIIILNYRGSTQLNVDLRKTWKNWKKSILTDFSELLDQLHCNSKSHEIHLCGASFGGALAMLISQSFHIKKCVLFSPLLDLRNQRKRGGQNFSKWFRSRFSKKDESDFSFENLVTNRNDETQILAFCSIKDVVLGHEMNLKLSSRSMEKKSNLKVILQNTTHMPKSFSQSYLRYNNALNWLLKN